MCVKIKYIFGPSLLPARPLAVANLYPTRCQPFCWQDLSIFKGDTDTPYIHMLCLRAVKKKRKSEKQTRIRERHQSSKISFWPNKLESFEDFCIEKLSEPCKLAENLVACPNIAIVCLNLWKEETFITVLQVGKLLKVKVHSTKGHYSKLHSAHMGQFPQEGN